MAKAKESAVKKKPTAAQTKELATKAKAPAAQPKEPAAPKGAPETQPATLSPAAAQPWKVGRVLKATLPLMSGEDVRAVQLALIAAGYHCGRSGANGVFGRETAQAVRHFQAFHRLIVDGKAGKYTVQALGGVWEPETVKR